MFFFLLFFFKFLELDEFLQDLDEDVEGMQSTIYVLQQELRKSKEALMELQQRKELSSSGNGSNESFIKGGDESNNGTESAEFRTRNESERLTNGNHSVLCSSRTTNQSNKVLDSPKPDSEKKIRTTTNNHEEGQNELTSELKKLDEATNFGDGSRIDNDVNSVRKRTFDESSNESDSIHLVKKSRRSSELSLDYNEDELCLMNGETKQENH